MANLAQMHELLCWKGEEADDLAELRCQLWHSANTVSLSQ